MIQISDLKGLAVKGLSQTKLFATHNSPAILTGVGIVGLVAAGVIAARQTLKLEDTLEEFEDAKSDIKRRTIDSKYTERHYQKDMVSTYVAGAWGLVKLYGPSCTLAAASVVAIVGGQRILHQRNVALAAAYKAVEHSFKEYRKRVVEEFGEEKDRQFKLGFRDEEQVDEETGEKKVVTVQDPNAISLYAKFFDESNENWVNNAEINKFFVQTQQNLANNKLQAQGYIFLNDVYKMLGMEPTGAGAVVGWEIDGEGNGYVDFGMYDFANDRKRAFVNGDERNILLDFNVDGPITHRFPKF